MAILRHGNPPIALGICTKLATFLGRVRDVRIVEISRTYMLKKSLGTLAFAPLLGEKVLCKIAKTVLYAFNYAIRFTHFLIASQISCR